MINRFLQFFNTKYGLILKKPTKTDYRFGDNQLELRLGTQKTLAPNGQWHDYLPEEEYQKKKIETFGCVSFSALNNIEIIAKALYGEQWNKSDRFLAKLSNTTRSGNTFSRVAETFKKVGAVIEEMWPFTEIFNWDNYYSEIPQNILDKGKEWLKEYTVGYDWVTFSPEAFMDALKKAPLQIVVKAWHQKDGMYYFPTTASWNHAVTLIGYKENEYWEIFDHYSPFLKKIRWDTPMYKYALRYSITNNNDSPMKTIKVKKKSAIYVLGKDNSVHQILTWQSYLDGIKLGLFQAYIEIDNIDKYKIGKSMAFIQ